MQGVKQEPLAQSLSAISNVHRQAPDVNRWDRVLRELLPNRLGEGRDVKGAGSDRVIAGHARLTRFGRDPGPAQATFFVLRDQRADKGVERRLAAGKLDRK